MKFFTFAVAIVGLRTNMNIALSIGALVSDISPAAHKGGSSFYNRSFAQGARPDNIAADTVFEYGRLTNAADWCNGGTIDFSQWLMEFSHAKSKYTRAGPFSKSTYPRRK